MIRNLQPSFTLTASTFRTQLSSFLTRVTSPFSTSGILKITTYDFWTISTTPFDNNKSIRLYYYNRSEVYLKTPEPSELKLPVCKQVQSSNISLLYPLPGPQKIPSFVTSDIIIDVSNFSVISRKCVTPSQQTCTLRRKAFLMKNR